MSDGFGTLFRSLEDQIAGSLQGTSNLSDVEDTGEARTNLQVPQVYAVAGVVPGVTNDSVDTAGLGRTFRVGDLWVDTVGSGLYVCTSAAEGAATWAVSGGGGPETLGLVNGEVGAMSVGHLVTVNDTGQAVFARSSDANLNQVIGVVTTGGASGEVVQVASSGFRTVLLVNGLVLGYRDQVWLSDTPGYGTNVLVAEGQYMVALGYVLAFGGYPNAVSASFYLTKPQIR